MTAKMSFCLRAATTLDEQELDTITEAIEKYTKAGMPVAEAEKAAVADAMAQLKQERASVVDALMRDHADKLGQTPKELLLDPKYKLPEVKAQPVLRSERPAEEPKPSRGTALTREAGHYLSSLVDKSSIGETFLGAKLHDALYNLESSPWLLNVMTNDQVAEGYKSMPAVARITKAIAKMSAAASKMMQLPAQVIQAWHTLDKTTSQAVGELMLESTIAQSHVSIKDADGKYLSAQAALAHPSNSHLERNDSADAAFAKLHAKFMALPEKARKVYDAVRDDLERQREASKAAARLNAFQVYGGTLSRVLSSSELAELANSSGPIRATFESLMGKAGTSAEMRAMSSIRDALREIDEQFGKVRGPYFPLVRFGSHVMVMRSAKVSEIDTRLQEAKTRVQNLLNAEPDVEDGQMEAHKASVAEARAEYAKILDEMNTAKKSSADYVVQFHESAAQAERARREMQAQNPDADVYATVREDYYRGISGATPSFISKMEEALAAALDQGEGVDAKVKAEALRSVRDLWMQQSPEMSALRSQLRRRDVSGIDPSKMVDAYARYSMNSAWRTSRLEHAREVTEGMLELGRDKRNADAVHVLNSFKKRFATDMAPPSPNKMVQALSNMSYFWRLGLNPSYYITNATQAWLVSLPVMAGRHGFNATRTEMSRASADTIKLLKAAVASTVKEGGVMAGMQLRLTDENLISLARDAGELEMLRELTNNGAIDITIQHDLGNEARGGSRIPVISAAMDLSGALSNYSEVYNRLATSLAAYRLESRKAEASGVESSKGQQAARDYATKIINQTHFNYSPENAPPIMRGQLGRLVFQFRRYQQGIAYLNLKLIRDAFAGESAEVRADARKGAAYMMGATLAASGASGLPIAAPIAFISKAFAALWPDDDEPEVVEMAYNGIKDALGTEAGRVIGRGLPTLLGLDISGKVGQGSIFSPVAFAKTDGKAVFSQDYWTQIGFSLLGPAAGLVAQMMDGVGQGLKGNGVKAAKELLPTAFANFVQAYELADRGVVTQRGDQLMTPEEFSGFSLLARSAGFAGVAQSDMYDQRSAFNNMKQRLKEGRSDTVREAVEGGDTEAVAAFNERHPTDAIKPADIRNYLKRRQEQRANMKFGIMVDKKTQGIADELDLQE